MLARNCDDWTSVELAGVGVAGAPTVAGWTDNFVAQCAGHTFHLYCFEQ